MINPLHINIAKGFIKGLSNKDLIEYESKVGILLQEEKQKRGL